MRASHVLSIALVLAALLAGAVDPSAAERARNVYRRAAARSGGQSDPFIGVSFSGAEDDLVKSKQRDTADMIAGLLPGKSANQVLRRCVELGLHCGGSVSAPPRDSEQWRNLPRHNRQ